MPSAPGQSQAVAPSICTASGHWRKAAIAAVHDHGCQQNVHELAALLTFLAAWARPRLVLEIGGCIGGSAWAWQQLPSVDEVITVTLPRPHEHWTCCQADQLHHIVWGDSTTDAASQQVRQLLRGRLADFLWIDGSHHYDAARSDWLTYGPLIRHGGLVGFHDVNDYPGHPDLQAHRLWDELRPLWRTAELIDRPGRECGTGLLWRDSGPLYA